MADIERKSNAIWFGELKGGNGKISLGSGVLKDEAYSFATRFEQAPGTNPEELIAAAHAACFSMAFSHTLTSKGLTPEKISTEATCLFSPQVGGGFKITGMRLNVSGRVPGIDQDTFTQICHEADQGCPVSNLLRSGLKIEIQATLES